MSANPMMVVSLPLPLFFYYNVSFKCHKSSIYPALKQVEDDDTTSNKRGTDILDLRELLSACECRDEHHRQNLGGFHECLDRVRDVFEGTVRAEHRKRVEEGDLHLKLDREYT